MATHLSPFRTAARQASKLCFRPRAQWKLFSSSAQRHRPDEPGNFNPPVDIPGAINSPNINPPRTKSSKRLPPARPQTSSRSPAHDLPPAPQDAEPPTATPAAAPRLKYSGPPRREAANHPPIDAASTRSSDASSRSSDPSRLIDALERNFNNPAPRIDANRRRADLQAATQRQYQVEAHMARVWRDGDVYSPHDLSPSEQDKARKGRHGARGGRRAPPVKTRSSGERDVIDELGVDPRLEYKNPAFLGSFVTEMGRIKHPSLTGLRRVNQRKVAKAIRRAMAMGILPTVHQHPELHPQRMTLRGQMADRSR